MIDEELNKKKRVNQLLNINNYHGKHSGRVKPVIISIALAVIPFLIYSTVFSTIVPFNIYLLFQVLITQKVIRVVLLNEGGRVERFRSRANNAYGAISDLIEITDITESGCINYLDGSSTFLLKAQPKFYQDSDIFSKDLEKFIRVIDRYEHDEHLINNNISLSSMVDIRNLSNLPLDDFRAERLNFYKLQDKNYAETSSLYDYIFAIHTRKSDWKILQEFLLTLNNNPVSKVFNSLNVLNRDDVIDVLSRDTGAVVSIEELINEKREVNNYYGSKILFFGDKVD